MGDIKVFRVSETSVSELSAGSFTVEKSLQTLVEKHLETFFGIRFLASEYSTGKTHGGRIDTLGIDENKCPVIIEYKRAVNENVINQGLFYLDWLMDHKANFKILVLDRFGKETADAIEWSSPRLLCIAGDFTRYDEHAVQQIGRNIELIRYRRYGEDLVLFELADVTSAERERGTEPNPPPEPNVKPKTPSDHLARANRDLQDLFEALKAYLLALGDDVQAKELKYYYAFKRIRNFACVEVYPQANKLLVFVKVAPDSITLQEGFTRDVRNIGHLGTGDLEMTIKSKDDLERAKPLLTKSYETS